MVELELRKEHAEYQKKYVEFLQNWNWQWSLHFFSEGFGTERLEREFQLWCRALGQKEHLYVCGIGLQNYKNSNHLHALLLGGNASGTKTLADVDAKIWEGRWPQNAMIKTVHANSVKYMVMKNTPVDCHCWLHEVGVKKLKQLQLHKLNGNI